MVREFLLPFSLTWGLGLILASGSKKRAQIVLLISAHQLGEKVPETTLAAAPCTSRRTAVCPSPSGGHRQPSRPGHLWTLVTCPWAWPSCFCSPEATWPCVPLCGAHASSSQQGDFAQIGWSSTGRVRGAKASGPAQAQAAGVLHVSPEGHCLWLVHLLLTSSWLEGCGNSGTEAWPWPPRSRQAPGFVDSLVQGCSCT